MFRFTEGTRTVSLFLGLLILLASCIGRQGQLKPLDNGVESTLELIDQPQLATFSELQTNPEIYQDQLIGVTGLYFRLSPPQCIPFNGPGAKWALISEDLRLDAVGFDQVTRLLPQDTLMTVEGFFRLYEGPIGCGKAAPKGTAWYLEVIKIIQPNPISGVIAGGFSGLYPRETPLPIAPGQTLEPSALTKTPENPNSTPLPDATTSPGVTITPTAITTIIPTATGTPTPTVFGTISTTASPTATSSTLTPAPTNTPTRTPIGTPTPLQATPTSAYPGPLPPTATPTTGAYPPPTSTVSSYPS